MSKETQISLAESSMFPGFRFSPTDEELISFYLKQKIEGSESRVQIISEIEICKHEPWDLPAKSVIQSDNEWFFFTPRGKKYPNGSQSKRATEYGYWKATGKERNVKSGSKVIGTKRTLVFHIGRAPKGERTEWIMHEYCMCEKSQESLVICRLRKNHEFRLAETTNRDSPNQRDTSPPKNSNAISKSGIDQMAVFGGDGSHGTREGCSKNCSSSYDSYSVEQIDSTSESDPKVANEFSQPECSGYQKDDGNEDDCYAEILKDDIVKLDESSLPTSDLFRIVANKSEADRKSKQPMQTRISQVQPFQGTASRRIRLKLQVQEAGRSNTKGSNALKVGTMGDLSKRVTYPNLEQQSKWSISMVSTRLVFAVFILLVVLLGVEIQRPSCTNLIRRVCGYLF
ncbi:NAC domain-containing protein 40-like [Malania oleifera]|uniref:NAC domain-containing protein 40-like n=1 Tax=Malania oleifera TaxID=397392 RepID=UPI0025ADBE3A|nr:NAC domain-containing protein 40-like [Malania oleifera]